MLASARLTEERVERVVFTADAFVGGHQPVRPNTVLQTVELPTGIADLRAGLSNVDGDTLTLAVGSKKTCSIYYHIVKNWNNGSLGYLLTYHSEGR